MQLHIGIDDTDSTKGGCTTYIAACLVEKITEAGIRFIDYPNIIRLNPNVPYKTRGNAAAALRLDIPNGAYNVIQEIVLEQIEKNSYIGRKGTDPAVIFLKGRPTSSIRQFSNRALWDILTEQEAFRVLRHIGASAAAYGARLGLIGALAAVGQTLNGDHTFELVAYRERQNYGTPRRVDENSVRRMEMLTTPLTFNSYDFENKRMLVTPHGPDPVLLGLRGETPQVVLKAFEMVTIREPIECWVIFRTNHGTDAHFSHATADHTIDANRPAVVRGVVTGNPERIMGGHVFFTLNCKNRRIRCAAFEPTGKFREIAAQLVPGDEVTVYGGVRGPKANFPMTINLEKMRIHRLAIKLGFENPACPQCGKHLKSAGKTQGFRCERCSKRITDTKKQLVEKERILKPGLYLPARKAHRHLTKPLSRYGREKRTWNRRPPSGKWHEP